MIWGKHKENMIRYSGRRQPVRYRLLWRGHDSLFIAVGRWRIRFMKPGWMMPS